MSEENKTTIAEVKQFLLHGIKMGDDHSALSYKLLCESELIELDVRLKRQEVEWMERPADTGYQQLQADPPNPYACAECGHHGEQLHVAPGTVGPPQVGCLVPNCPCAEFVPLAKAVSGQE